MVANDNSFTRSIKHVDLVRVGQSAREAFNPNPCSILSEYDQQWFAVRGAVAVFLAKYTKGTIGVPELRRARMVADHLCGAAQ